MAIETHCFLVLAEGSMDDAHVEEDLGGIVDLDAAASPSAKPTASICPIQLISRVCRPSGRYHHHHHRIFCRSTKIRSHLPAQPRPLTVYNPNTVVRAVQPQTLAQRATKQPCR